MNNVTSPDNSDNGVEREILAKGLTAPRVTPAAIENEIVATYYFTAMEGNNGAHEDLRVGDEVPLGLLTFCVLVLRNGFTVTGESACASPENFDRDIGRRIARENAKQKLWPLLGFRLRDQLST